VLLAGSAQVSHRGRSGGVPGDRYVGEVDRTLALLATLAAGGLVAFQPPANSQMGKVVGPLGATLVSLLVSTALILAIMVFAGGFGELRHAGDIRPAWLLGGVAGAAIVSVSLVTVRTLGAGGVVAATVCTQLIVSAVLDRAGAFGLTAQPLGPLRLLGFGLLIAGTLIVTLR